MGGKRRAKKTQGPTGSVATVDLRSAAEERYIAYALSVITSRALPDVRDGLKPVQRRILFAMHQNLHLTAASRPRKSAAVVGEVLGKYHPHGDLAAYEAMVRMAQPFALRYPLVRGEGNFGSLDGDSPAAMRYTEARLTPIAEELLNDIRHETVDFRDNYDATLREPVVLPAGFPQLLANGSTGIAVGMATNIPPHNLGEATAALLALIRDPTLSTKDLCRFIQGPDFPTGGEIVNPRSELVRIYETGQGPVRLRGQYTTEGKGRARRLIITSVPYNTNKARIVEEIGEHIRSRKLPLATDVRDESTDAVRIVVELKADADPEAVAAYLFKHTGLQTNFNVNLTALVPTPTPGVGQPARLTLKDLCRQFLDFRLEVVTRRLQHERRELQARLHVLEGFLKLFGAIEPAVEIIRAAASRTDAQQALMQTFQLDAIQADAILDTRLYQLARLEIEKVRKEHRDKQRRTTEIARLLKNEKARWQLVAGELETVARKYGDARRTAIGTGAELIYNADAYIVHEDTTVVVTRDGWLKRVGEIKDPSSTRVREGDHAKWVLRANTRDNLALFSNTGGLYVMRVANVPATTGYGEPVQSVLNFKDGERIVAAGVVRATPSAPAVEARPVQGTLAFLKQETPPSESREPQSNRWLVATKEGMGFLCRPDVSETTRSGRRIARLREGDEVVTCVPAAGDTVTAATGSGKALTFPVEELPELVGPGRGVILMRLDKGDYVIGAVCHPHAVSPLVVADDGSVHRFNLPLAGHRAQKGRKVLKRYRPIELLPSPSQDTGS